MTTAAFLRSAFESETDEVWLALLTISHSTLEQPIRVVNNTVDVTSNGETFQAFAFDLLLPDDEQDSPAIARLEIDNVSLEIIQSVRLMNTPASVLIQIIRHSLPDTIEVSLPDFSLRNVSWDAQTVTGDLVLEDFVQEPYPAGTFTPAGFPGAF